MKTPQPKDLLAVAVDAAQAAGRHALENYSRRRELAKDLGNDIKLKLDIECQAIIEGLIGRAFPDHSFLGEEGQTMRADGAPCWIVDPLDGTLNFSHGMPLWCNSVAVRVNGDVVAGAVNIPMLNECYTATIDTDAACNETPVRVSATEHMDQSLLIAGFPNDMHTDPASLSLFRRVLSAGRRVRLLGAAAVDICFVAAGRAEAFLERGIYIWDVAAGDLIVRRAGGRSLLTSTGFSDGRLAYLASNRILFDQLATLSGFNEDAPAGP